MIGTRPASLEEGSNRSDLPAIANPGSHAVCQRESRLVTSASSQPFPILDPDQEPVENRSD